LAETGPQLSNFLGVGTSRAAHSQVRAWRQRPEAAECARIVAVPLVGVIRNHRKPRLWTWVTKLFLSFVGHASFWIMASTSGPTSEDCPWRSKSFS